MMIWLVAASALWSWWRQSWAVLLVIGAAAVSGSAVVTLAAANAAVAMALFTNRQVARRQQQNRAGLPEFAESVAIRARSDSDLADAIKGAAGLASGLGPALLTVAKSLQQGLPATAAVESLPRSDPEVSLLSAAIELAYGNHIETERVFTDSAQSLRQRRLKRQDIASQAAQGRASAGAMFVLPWIFVAAEIAVSGPGGFWHDSTLQLLLMVATTLSLLGAWWSLVLVARVEALR